MEVDALGLGNALSEQASGGAEISTQDQFLQLLVAQMENQDPLNPQDGTEFIAQLAQFASLEQAAETNSRLAVIEQGQTAGLRMGFTDLVGKSVTARSERITIPLDPASNVTRAIHLGDSADHVEVIVRNSNGNEVDRMDLGANPEGEVAFAWDGSNVDPPLPAGEYSFEVVATNEEAKVDAYTTITGVVQMLDFTNSGVEFLVGQGRITPADIVSIEESLGGTEE